MPVPQHAARQPVEQQVDHDAGQRQQKQRREQARDRQAIAGFENAEGEPRLGAAGAETGLAFRILEAGYRLAIPRLFAALFLLSLTGIVIYLVLDFVSRRLLRHWHESAAASDEE